jgi:glycosyltransferase involved in cell wall biosynthesis
MDIIRKAYALDECGSINKPKVTALVPSYNHSRYLRQRIESVMRQTYSNVELIVIDDCSDDDSDEVIKSLQVQYGFIYVRNTCNSRSPFASWERGIRLGTGDYIWICESDDYAEPGFLEVTVDALMRNKGAVMAYCDSWIVNEQDQKIDHTDTYFHEIWREFRWDQGFVSAGADELRNFQLRGQTVPNMSSALFTMNAFKKAYNPFLKKFRLTGDWLFVGWVLRHGSAVFCKQTLSNFRKHELTARVRVKSARSQAEYIVTKYLLFQLSGRNWCEFSAIMSTDAIRFLYEPAGPFDVLRALLRISFLKTVQCGGLFAASLAMNSHLVRKFWQRYKLVKGGI